MKRTLLIATLIAMLLGSCKKQGPNDEPGLPDKPGNEDTIRVSLALEIDTVGEKIVSFSVITDQSPVEVVYIASVAELSDPAEELFLRSDVSREIISEKAAEFTIDDLLMDTPYHLYAAVKYQDVYSSVKSVDFTTLPNQAEVGELSIKVLEVTDHSYKFEFSTRDDQYYRWITESQLLINSQSKDPYDYVCEFGIPSQGPITVDWVNGEWFYGPTGPIKQADVGPDQDYVIYAIRWDFDMGYPLGDVIVATLHTEKAKEGVGAVDVELLDVKAAEVKVKFTPSDEIENYMSIVLPIADVEDADNEYGGDSFLINVIEYAETQWYCSRKEGIVEMSFTYVTGTFHDFYVNEEYVILTLAYDKDGGKQIIRTHFIPLE